MTKAQTGTAPSLGTQAADLAKRALTWTKRALTRTKQLLLWLLGGEYPLGQEWEKLTFTRWLYIPVGVSFSVSAAVALWIGLQDLFSPTTLPVQLVGFSYVAAGAISLYGAFNTFLLAHKARGRTLRGMARNGDAHSAIIYLRDTSAQPLKFMALAAVAGLYLDLTIAFYAFHYRPAIVIIFAVLAIVCACLARVTMPVLWNDLSRGLKLTGLSLAALGAVAQFWYQSVYVPGNIPIGINYVVTLGPLARSGGGRVAQVNVAAEDPGPVPAVTLASMIIVRGVIPGKKKTSFLEALPLVDPPSFFFPNDTLSREFLVPIKNPKIKALQVIIFVDFARTTWLTLDNKDNKAVQWENCYKPQAPQEPQKCGNQRLLSCPQSMQYRWDAVQSNLRDFAQGNWTVYSDWKCTYWRLSISAHAVPNHSAIGSDLGIIYSKRTETLVLPKIK